MPDPVLVKVYYANWCPHCKSFSNDANWKEFVEKAKQYGGKIQMSRVEVNNFSPEDEQEANGFPTIKVFIGGN